MVSPNPSVHRPTSRRFPEKLYATPAAIERINELQQTGCELIGEGDDAIVLSEPGSDTVLRICQNPTPFTHFVALAQGTGTEHLPIIFSHEVRDEVAFTRMERLEHIPKNEHGIWAQVNLAATLAHAIVDNRPYDLSDFSELNNSLRDATIEIGMGAREYYYALDLSADNFMRRLKTKEIVFNDPWSPWGE